MKKKIAILGSTGSIGKSLLDIINKDKKNFDIVLLVANKNYKLILKQANKFNVKNIIITDKKSFNILNKKKFKNLKIYNDFNFLNKIFLNKIDYIMSSITGIDGLEPTFKCIKFTKNIAIANKEAIICAWNILKKELIKNKTNFLPIDSEHFSIWNTIKNYSSNEIDKVFITASGGPFLNLPINKFNKIKVSDAIKHPKWKMGKKISIDSSTMMNKVFEIIEAKKIFDLKYSQLEILIHKDSYLHSIVKFKSGFTKLVVHDTDMKIPIFNSLYKNREYFYKKSKIDLFKLNTLNLLKPNLKKFPLMRLIKEIPLKNSMFETVIVSINDTLVDLFMQKKINYQSISKIFFLLLKEKRFYKYRNKKVINIKQIKELNKKVQLIVKSRYI